MQSHGVRDRFEREGPGEKTCLGIGEPLLRVPLFFPVEVVSPLRLFQLSKVVSSSVEVPNGGLESKGGEKSEAIANGDGRAVKHQ
jgi:hypothetical protein